jgi:hypothetical protein
VITFDKESRMPHPILLKIQTWLKQHRDIDADLEEGHLTFSVTGLNRFVNRVMLFNGGRVISWYGYTLIDASKVKDSPHRGVLVDELLRINDRLTLGRWALTAKDMLLFDVSMPVGVAGPCDSALHDMFELMVEGFDRMVSRIKLLLDTGVLLAGSGADVPVPYLQTLISRPDIYPAMCKLGLLSTSADAVLRQLLPLPELPESASSSAAEPSDAGIKVSGPVH